MGGYLILNSLFLWFFDTPYHLLNRGFADFNPFFELSPMLLLLLIPAIGMRSFSEERSNGTFELLLTKPIPHHIIYGGKFIGAYSVFFMALIPTAFHLIALNRFLAEESSLETGSVFSGYLATLFLGALFLSISLCCSLLFKSQVSAFLSGFLICFFLFYGWNFIVSVISQPFWFVFVTRFGAEFHFVQMSRGIIDVENLVYFLGIPTFFINIGVVFIKKLRQ